MGFSSSSIPIELFSHCVCVFVYGVTRIENEKFENNQTRVSVKSWKNEKVANNFSFD